MAATFGICSVAQGAPATPRQTDDTGFQAGAGNAVAQSFRVNPTAAALSIGISFGTSLAGFQNTVAKSESSAIDLGVIGTSLAAEPCDGGDPTLPPDQQPHSLTADSRQEGAGSGFSENEEFTNGQGFTKNASADPTPFADAETDSAPVGDEAAVLIQGARSDARAGVVNGDTREAIATADVGLVKLFGGLVELGNLHWEAVHHTGAADDVTGTFSIGSLKMDGAPVAIPSDDPSSALESVNAALVPLGIEIRPPVAHESAGILFVDPMAIGVVPSPTRDSTVGGLLGTLQPVRQSLTDALLAQDCKNATYITIADIAVGSITGSGSFSIELGGVQAFTGELIYSNALNFSPPPALPSLPPIVQGGGPLSAGGSSSLSTSSAPAPAAATPQPAANNEIAAAVPASAVEGARGGALAGVAGAGLVALAATAEGDRRKMRRAQRMIPPEVSHS